MSEMNYTSEQQEPMSELERVTAIEQEIRGMRFRTFAIIEQSHKAGDEGMVGTLYRLSSAFDDALSLIQACTYSLHFGDD
jgi:hypothetical protein